MKEDDNLPLNNKKLTDADKCIGVGLGVGTLGIGATLLVGATCPICYIAAPALVGAGLWNKRKAARKKLDTTDQPLKSNKRKF